MLPPFQRSGLTLRKSDNEVLIPITPQLRHLIDKYDWQLPQVKYYELNELIRDGFKEAKLSL